MRVWTPQGHYVITGRGLVWSGLEPDPPFEMGEIIQLATDDGCDGIVGLIAGLERHPIAGSPQSGRPVGVWLLTSEG